MNDEKTLFLYSCALEDGDFETIASIWEMAAMDSALTQKLLALEMREPAMNGNQSVIRLPVRRTTPHRSLAWVAILTMALVGFTSLWVHFSGSTSVGGNGLTPTPPVSTQIVNIATYGAGTINGATWSPDGEIILAYGSTGFWYFDAGNLETPPTFLEIDVNARQAVYTEDGQQIIFSDGSMIYLLEVASGEIIHELDTGLEGYTVFEYENRVLVFYSYWEASLNIWNVDCWCEQFVLDTASPIDSDLNDDATLLGMIESEISGEIASVLIYDLQSGNELFRQEVAQLNYPSTILVDENQVTVSSSIGLFWWEGDVQQGEPGPINTLDNRAISQFLPLGENLFLLHNHPGILIYGQRFFIMNNGELQDLPPSEPFNIFSRFPYSPQLAFHPEQDLVLFVSPPAPQIVDPFTGTIVDEIPAKYWHARLNDIDVYQDHLAWTTDNALFIDNMQIEIDYPDIEQVRYVSMVDTGAIINIRTFDDREVFLHSDGEGFAELATANSGIGNWILSHDRSTIVFVSSTGFPRVMNVETGQVTYLKPVPKSPDAQVSKTVFSPDDQLLVLPVEDKIYIYDRTTGDYLPALQGHADDVLEVVFNSDGSRLMSLDAKQNWIVWNTSTWQLISSTGLPFEQLRNIVLSPDSTIFAGSEWDDIVLLDASTLEEIARVEGDGGYIYELVFEDETRLISRASDGLIRVWDLRLE